MSVLIVEDDPALGRLLRTLIVRERLAVDLETRGDDALRAILAGRYRAIVLDLMLSGMSGFDIVRQLARVRPELLHRIIVLTAVSQSQLDHFEHRSEVRCLIRKPFDIAEFVNTVRQCVAENAPQRFQQIEMLTRWLATRAAASGAQTAIVAANSGRDLSLAATFGYAEGIVEPYFPLPISGKYPLSAAVRTGRPVWLASLTPPVPEYPLLLPIWTINAATALAAVPLVKDNTTLGAIGWSFVNPQRFDEMQRAALGDMAAECAAILAKHAASLPDTPPRISSII
jgi:DNA-binding response OmpR family regulator